MLQQILRRSVIKSSLKCHLSTLSREQRRQLRKQNDSTGLTRNSSNKSSTLSRITFASSVALASSTGIWFTVLQDDTKSSIRSVLHESPLGSIYDWIVTQVTVMVKPFTDPSREKLLPDWPMKFLNLPPNTPAPPTLVLALEDVLMHSEWDRKHGWRHAKRPGVDKFLEVLSRHYEIVIFSTQMMGVGEEIVIKLDKNQRSLHQLYRDATHFTNGVHVKDVSKLNRDVKKIVIVDHNPANYQLQPRNGINVSAFTNTEDRFDHALEDLIPFLQAVAAEKVQDVPALLDDFRNEDGLVEDIGTKYQARKRMVAEKTAKRQARGLGGLMRGRLSSAASGSSNSGPNTAQLPPFKK